MVYGNDTCYLGLLLERMDPFLMFQMLHFQIKKSEYTGVTVKWFI